MTNNNMDVQTKGQELIITRVFNAPRELVFEAYSNCEHLKNWWGPRTWPMDECTMDFREGGEWRYCLRGPNEGDESWGKAIYQKIKQPEKIVYRDHFTDSKGTVNKEMPTMLITVDFIDKKDNTKLISHTLFDSPDQLQSILDMGMIEGFTETWDRLEELLEKVTSGN